MIVAPLQATVTENRTRLTVLSDHLNAVDGTGDPVPFLSGALFIMVTEPKVEHPDWTELLARLQKEFHSLPEDEKQWLKERVDAIAHLQLSLNALFERAGGISTCTDCDGECCGCGRHHLTLTNLLAYLFADEAPPTPDFSKTCPYLGKTGCLLPVSRRPYNCITFFCDRLESRLDKPEQQQLRTLDQQLRLEYQAVAERCPAASLRGLWIALEKVGQGQILHSN